jgi:hypothetical protein
MKKILILFLLLGASVYSYCQTYADDAKKAGEIIKSKAFKNSYKYMITFADAQNAAFNVKPNTNYAVMFVYDNTKRPLTNFKGYLMSKDSTLSKKYSQTSYYAGETGMARVKQIRFLTPAFAGDTRPVKLEANPKATIYVFYK